MNFRFTLAVSLALCAQATLTATPSYDFGTIPVASPWNSQGISLADESYAAGTTWTENYVPGGPASQQIVCVVALGTNTPTNACGTTGPGSAANVPVYAPTGTPGGGVSDYLMVDGDPEWGAPVSTDMTGLISGDTYKVSFYQAASEESKATPHTAYDDSWLVYQLPTSDSAGVYSCTQAYCSDNGGTKTLAAPGTLVFNGDTPTTLMADAAGASTAWEQESFTFVATAAANQFLEFVTNVTTGGTDVPLAAGTTFQPPMLDLADVTITQQGGGVPEPGTWTLTLLGAGLVFAGSRLRRRLSGRR